ncbi:MAG TPA: radical SAM protein [Nitrospiraceae bacterium]|nr:radical SAM protein [Nitrospiraceae bacterium]
MFRGRGAVTVLGGPHARSYPQDAAKYFDYVVGFTDKNLIQDILADCSQHRPLGTQLASAKQPTELPGVKERWKFIEPTIAKAPTSFKVVPMIGSMGCPYTCGFCVDANVDYQPLSFNQISEDLKFLRTKMKRPIVAWHDPNFGVRFQEYMRAIETAIPPNSIDFIAESTLSLLSEPHLKRLQQNGFKAILPGIESWYDMGEKSRTGRHIGQEKVKQVADHINMILRYIPYVQVNFVLGLDCDEGAEPFELTKQFLDLAPGAFPAFSLLTAFGQAAPFNRELQRDGRVLPFPFHFLDNNHAMNVRPKHYAWPEFYDHVVNLSQHAFSWPMIAKRVMLNRGWIPKWFNFIRSVSSEGFGRIKYHTKIRSLLDTDLSVRSFLEGETSELPRFYAKKIGRKLGPLYDMLPEGATMHDHHAYLKSYQEPAPPLVALDPLPKVGIAAV